MPDDKATIEELKRQLEELQTANKAFQLVTKLQPHEMSATLKILRDFDGDPNQLNAFLSRFRLAGERCKHPDDMTTLLYHAIGCIIGAARDKFEQHGAQITNFEQFEEALIFLFRPTRSYITLQNELNEARQLPSETISAYHSRLVALNRGIKEAIRSDKAFPQSTSVGLTTHFHLITSQRFIHGLLRSDITAHLEHSRASERDFDQLLTTALEYESMHPRSTTRTSNSLPPRSTAPTHHRRTEKYCSYCKTPTHNTRDCRIAPRCTYCQFNGHTIQECRRKIKDSSLGRNSETVTINTATSSATSDKTCAYCKHKGHLINECRKREYNNAHKNGTSVQPPSQSAQPPKPEGIKKINLDGNSMFALVLHSLETKPHSFNLLLDTGAEVSLIQYDILSEKLRSSIDTSSRHTFSGIQHNADHCQSMGTVEVPFGHENHTYSIRFHVVNDNRINLPLHGILGHNILHASRASILYDEQIIKFAEPPIQLPLYCEHNIAPRTRTVLSVRIAPDSPGEGLIELPSSAPIVSPCAIYTAQADRSIPLVVTNPSTEPARLLLPPIKLQPANEILVWTLQLFEPVADRNERLLSALRLEHLTPSERPRIEKILLEFSSLFYLEGDSLQSKVVSPHELRLEPGTQPIFTKPYRVPEFFRSEIEKATKNLLQQGIIRPSKSPWNAPLLMVPKKADASGKRKYRMVIDYRNLNKVMIADKHPLPRIEDIFDQLGRSRLFTTMDLASGFHQIPMEPADMEKTAFSTPFGHYEYTAMPMGLKNAPAAFQRIVNQAMTGLLGTECFLYLDDVIIASTDFESHLVKLRIVLQRLAQHRLLINPDKSEFAKTELLFLGHIVTDHGIKPNPEKTSALVNMPSPKDVTAVQRFLGLTGYYRRFIDRYAEKTKPLTQLLRKNATFEWSKDTEQALRQLITEVTSPKLVLQYPDFSKTFYLHTDASNVAIGSVLSQISNGTHLPIVYSSRTLNSAEANYSTIEKELLAIVWSIQQNRPYLFGRKFIIRTDHQPLTWLFRVKDPSSRLARWQLKLQEYDYSIEYVPGSENKVADCLSRIFTLQHTATELSIARKVMQQQMQERLNTSEFTRYPSLPYVTLRQAKDIAIFTSPDLAAANPILRNPDLYDLDTGEIRVRKRATRTTFICCLQESAHVPFEIRNVRTLCLNLHALCEKHNIWDLAIFDDFDVITGIEQIAYMEHLLNSWLQPVKLSWLTVGKRPNNISTFLKHVHDHRLSGHPGFHRMVNQLHDLGYYWKGLRKDVLEFVRTCPQCQLSKVDHKPNKPPITITDTCKEPLVKIYMDLVGPFRITPTGLRHILSIQDNLTKFLYLVPLADASASTVFFEFARFVTSFGIPQAVVTDQGQQFCSDLMKYVLDNLGIQKLVCSPYHPESNGALERTHGSIKEYLKIYLSPDQDNWDALLPSIVYTFNTQRHTATGFPPFELMFGRKPRLPQYESAPQTSYDAYAAANRQVFDDLFTKAHKALITNKLKTKAISDCRRRAREPNLKPNDKAYVSTKKALRTGAKTTASFTGPYKVTKVVPPNVFLEINGQEKCYHASRVKLHRTSTVATVLSFFLCISAAISSNIIEPINPSNGIYFSWISSVGLHTGDWTFITTYNTTILREKERYLDIIASSLLHTEEKTCAHGSCFIRYSASLRSRFLRLSTLLDDVVNSVSDDRLTKTKTRRKRWAPFEFISTIDKYLFGTPDADDGRYYDEALRKLNNDDASLQRLLRAQIRLFNNSLINFENSAKVFQRNQDTLDTALRNMTSEINRQQANISTLQVQQQILQLTNLYDAIYEDVHSEVMTLQTAILFAKRDILHPAILSPTELQQLLNEVKLPNDRIFPIDVSSTLAAERYSDFSIMHTRFIKHILVFYLVVPVINIAQYNLYELLPLPFSNDHPSTRLFFYDPPAPYLLISSEQTRYTLLDDTRDCRYLYTYYQICRTAEVSTIRNPPCVVRLFLQDQASCTLKSMAAVPSIWKRLHTGEWLFTTNEIQQIHMICDKYDTQLTIPYAGLLRIPNDCRAQIGSRTLFGHHLFNSTFPRHINLINLTVPEVNLQKINHIIAPQLEHIDLAVYRDLHAQLQHELDTINTGFGPVQQHHINWTLSVLQIFGILLFLYLFYRYIFRRYCCSSTAPNVRTNISVQLPSNLHQAEEAIPLQAIAAPLSPAAVSRRYQLRTRPLKTA